jgi:hypothetical protein
MPGAYTSFYQREDLTTRLKNILDEYPPGVGPYKEFLQNADDARANRFALCLDRTAYPCERLLAPQMAEWQGPALLIWNSSSFSESVRSAWSTPARPSSGCCLQMAPDLTGHRAAAGWLCLCVVAAVSRAGLRVHRARRPVRQVRGRQPDWQVRSWF